MVSYLNLRNMVHRPASQVRTFSLLPKDLTVIFLIPYLHMRIYTGHHCKVISKSSAL